MKLEPPQGPDPKILGQLSAPALEAAGDSGQTKIEVLHDPGHVLLPGLPPG